MNILLLTSVLGLEWFDQLKLAEYAAQLPTSVANRQERSAPGPTRGKIITVEFPKRDSAFKIACENTYYNDSSYASEGKCDVRVDLNHSETAKSYDELRFAFQGEEARAWYDIIPMGRPRKEARSFGKDPGTTFEGKSGQIFHYYFSCSESECVLRLSEKALR